MRCACCHRAVLDLAGIAAWVRARCRGKLLCRACALPAAVLADLADLAGHPDPFGDDPLADLFAEPCQHRA